MAVDPTDPKAFDEQDERRGGSADEADDADTARREAEPLGDGVPEADAVEQRTEVRPEGDEPLTHIDPDTASEADAVEQARVVGLDEDDYR
ncbi:hypothetical protein [Streptomyces sp. NPDC014894]|uniref:hypothetical protein n=1 Tax=Streptomyces sp. NPDC014894 TaxID=3364931 RepID=UPI0036F9E509